MPKDLQALINKAEKALPKGEGIDVEVKTEAIDDPKESVVTKKATNYRDPKDGPDELVRKHAEDERRAKLLVDRDNRVNEGMDILLSAADSILSARRCREA